MLQHKLGTPRLRYLDSKILRVRHPNADNTKNKASCEEKSTNNVIVAITPYGPHQAPTSRWNRVENGNRTTRRNHKKQ